jgi:hypothetical protein
MKVISINRGKDLNLVGILKATEEKSKIRIQINNPVVRILVIFTLASYSSVVDPE